MDGTEALIENPACGGIKEFALIATESNYPMSYLVEAPIGKADAVKSTLAGAIG